MVLLLWLLVLFAGCVRAPLDEARCQLLLTPSLEESVARALKQPSFVEGDFPSSCWWQEWKDDQLTALIEQAIADNPTIKQAAARLDRADEEALIKRARLFPEIGVSAQASFQYYSKNSFFRAFAPQIPGHVNEYTLGVDFVYECDFWGKNRNLFQAALGEAKATEAEEAQVCLALSVAVAASYFKWQALSQKKAFLDEQYRLVQTNLHLTQNRREHALDTVQQNLNAQQRLWWVRQNMIFVDQLLKLEEHRLKMLIGLGPETRVDIKPESLPTRTVVALPRELSSDWLARRPDLMAQIWRVEAAAHLVGAAKTDFYPRIDLTGLLGLDSVFINKFFSWPSRTANLIPALHLPIFTAGRIRAQYRAAEASFKEAIETYNDLLLRSVQEVADQLTIFKTADETLAIQEQIVRSQQETTGLSEKRYETGLKPQMEWLDAHEILVREELIFIDQAFDRTLAALNLVKALGGGYKAPEVPIYE